MKTGRISTRASIIAVITTMAILLILPAGADMSSGSNDNFGFIDQEPNPDPLNPGNQNGSGDLREEQKEIPMELKGFSIFGHNKQTAYPNIPF